MYRIAWIDSFGEYGQSERLDYFLAQEMIEDLMAFGDGSIYYWLEVA